MGGRGPNAATAERAGCVAGRDRSSDRSVRTTACNRWKWRASSGRRTEGDRCGTQTDRGGRPGNGTVIAHDGADGSDVSVRPRARTVTEVADLTGGMPM